MKSLARKKNASKPKSTERNARQQSAYDENRID